MLCLWLCISQVLVEERFLHESCGGLSSLYGGWQLIPPEKSREC